MDQPGGFKRTQARLMCEAGVEVDDSLLAYMIAEQCLLQPAAAVVPLPAKVHEPAAIEPLPAARHVPKHAAVINLPARAVL